MNQAASRRPLNAEARFRSQVSPCKICGGQNGSVTGFSPSISVLPCQCHSTDAPISSLSTRFSYQRDKGAKPWNVPKISAASEIGQYWIHSVKLRSLELCHKIYLQKCNNKKAGILKTHFLWVRTSIALRFNSEPFRISLLFARPVSAWFPSP